MLGEVDFNRLCDIASVYSYESMCAKSSFDVPFVIFWRKMLSQVFLKVNQGKLSRCLNIQQIKVGSREEQCSLHSSQDRVGIIIVQQHLK